MEQRREKCFEWKSTVPEAEENQSWLNRILEQTTLRKTKREENQAGWFFIYNKHILDEKSRCYYHDLKRCHPRNVLSRDSGMSFPQCFKRESRSVIPAFF